MAVAVSRPVRARVPILLLAALTGCEAGDIDTGTDDEGGERADAGAGGEEAGPAWASVETQEDDGTILVEWVSYDGHAIRLSVTWVN